jgi:hypothetical protein
MSKFTRLRIRPAAELRWRELARRIVAVPNAEIDNHGSGINRSDSCAPPFGRLRRHLEDRERQNRIRRADARCSGYEAV